MCMFCVIQKGSRRVATMLPWLVIPLIGLWALSQLLPPAFQFEITSPRLACVFVLLITLFWYEVLMPHLSAWRVRRNALLRERKRFEALELQKMKKTATRKCRNCLTPYRDQNPGGGKFMCSYCGHISKRPVLDLPIPPDMSNSGLIKELFGKGGKILNENNFSDTISLCNQEWLDNGNWLVNGSFPVKISSPPRKNGVVLFSRRESCLAEKSYSGVYFFSCKLLTSFLPSIRWLWRKVFRISSSKDSSSDAEHRMSKRGENGGTGQESRSEKARRKAEEKRQARLEKELLEEEERKQREEVARLVEERRRLRDEKIEAENRARGAFSLREKDSKKEAERRRQERRKEKDKSSSKSNSDVDELERKAGNERERKRDSERKVENDQRESSKTGLDSVKCHNADTAHGAKGNTGNNFSRENVGSRYFDRMRGTFLSSSKAFAGGGFFGKAASSAPSASKDVKPNSCGDYSSRCDFNPSKHLPGKIIMNGDGKVINRAVIADTQCKTTQMSWHQLFVRTSPPSSNVISRPSAKFQAENQSSQLPCPVSSALLYDNPIDLPSPFVLPSLSRTPVANISGISVSKDPLFSCASERPPDIVLEEPEHFEDPCYEPDPVSLLGPVSESLDNFQLDRGASYVRDECGKSCPMVNVSSPPEVARPSPIEFPLSRLRAFDEKQNYSSHFSGSPKARDVQSFQASDLNNSSDMGSWHMWNSSPLGPDGFSLVGCTNNWIAPLERSRFNEEMYHSPQKSMASLFLKDDHVTSGIHSSQKVSVGNFQNGSAFGASIHSLTDQDLWLQNAFSPPRSASESHSPISPTEPGRKKVFFGSPSSSAANHAAPSTASSWPKNEWSIQGLGEGVRSSPTVKSHVGGLYSAPDVQSLWSFE